MSGTYELLPPIFYAPVVLNLQQGGYYISTRLSSSD